MTADIASRIRAGWRPTLAEKAESCATLEELDGFLDGFAMTNRDPPRDVIEAVARRRAELMKAGAA